MNDRKKARGGLAAGLREALPGETWAELEVSAEAVDLAVADALLASPAADEAALTCRFFAVARRADGAPPGERVELADVVIGQSLAAGPRAVGFVLASLRAGPRIPAAPADVWGRWTPDDARAALATMAGDLPCSLAAAHGLAPAPAVRLRGAWLAALAMDGAEVAGALAQLVEAGGPRPFEDFARAVVKHEAESFEAGGVLAGRCEAERWGRVRHAIVIATHYGFEDYRRRLVNALQSIPRAPGLLPLRMRARRAGWRASGRWPTVERCGRVQLKMRADRAGLVELVELAARTGNPPTWAAAQLRRRGLDTWTADDAVHLLHLSGLAHVGDWRWLLACDLPDHDNAPRPRPRPHCPADDAQGRAEAWHAARQADQRAARAAAQLRRRGELARALVEDLDVEVDPST